MKTLINKDILALRLVLGVVLFQDRPSPVGLVVSNKLTTFFIGLSLNHCWM